MNRATHEFPLTVDVRDGLSELAIEELQYIVDGVRQKFARAPLDLVESELRAYQRVRQLDPAVVRRLAEAMSSDAHPPNQMHRLVGDSNVCA